jgi:Domain of unknown function (DUF4118)
VIDQCRLEVTGRVGDTPIHEPVPNLAEMRTCQSLGIPSIGLDELRVATSPRWKADVRHMADLVGAGYFLMLRFWISRSDSLHGRTRNMSNPNPLMWSKPSLIWSYGIAVFSVAAALITSRWPALHLEAAPVSLFLCAVMLSAWFGGVRPALLATALSALAFYYYFLPPIYSLDAKPGQIPRLVIFMVSTLFVGSLSGTESLRRARDDLRRTV